MSDTRARALTSVGFGRALLTRDDARVRAIAACAIAGGVLYLGWRAAATLVGVPAWLSVPLLALEAWSVLTVALLAVQAWRVPRPRAVVPDPDAVAGVLVLAARSAPEALERTLLAVGVLAGAQEAVVCDDRIRPELADYCARQGARYLIVDDPLRDGLAALEVERALVLAAGQVPMPDLIRATASHFDEPDVAVVQCRFEFANPAALTHTSAGRSEQDLFNFVLAPALGERGAAPWLGGGAVVRRGALLALEPIPADSDANRAVRTTVRLLGAGWKIRFHREAMIRTLAPETLEAYLRGSHHRAYSALRVLLTSDNPLWAPGLTLRHRAVVFAGIARYLAGVNRLALVALLLLVLATGLVPLAVTRLELLGIVLPVHVLLACAAISLGRGTLAFGDRSRHALRTMGAYAAAAARAFVPAVRRRVAVPSTTAAGRPLARVGLLVWATGLLDTLLIARALDLRVELGLPDFEGNAIYPVILAGALSLLLMLDVMQVLVARRGARTFFRSTVDLGGRFEAVDARVVDLTPSGARLELPRTTTLRPVHGDRVEVELGLLDPDGQAAPLRVGAIVRNSAAGPGWVRYGVEFVELDRAAAAAIATAYWVVEPYRALRFGGGHVERLTSERSTQAAQAPRRLRQALALVSAAALALSVSAMVPADAAAARKKERRAKIKTKRKREKAPVSKPPAAIGDTETSKGETSAVSPSDAMAVETSAAQDAGEIPAAAEVAPVAGADDPESAAGATESAPRSPDAVEGDDEPGGTGSDPGGLEGDSGEPDGTEEPADAPGASGGAGEAQQRADGSARGGAPDVEEAPAVDPAMPAPAPELPVEEAEPEPSAEPVRSVEPEDELPPDDGGGGGDDGVYADGLDDPGDWDEAPAGSDGDGELGDGGDVGASGGGGQGAQHGSRSSDGLGHAPGDSVVPASGEQRGGNAARGAERSPMPDSSFGQGRQVVRVVVPVVAVPVSGEPSQAMVRSARAGSRAIRTVPPRLRVALDVRRGRFVVRVPFDLPPTAGCTGRCVLRAELRVRTGRRLLVGPPNGPLLGVLTRGAPGAAIVVPVDPERLQRHLHRRGARFDLVARLDVWLRAADGSVVRLARTVTLELDPAALTTD